MAVFAAVFRTLVDLLNAQFGHIDTSPKAQHEEALRDGGNPEIEIPGCCGKMTLTAQERRSEIVVRLLLSEEAAAGGLLGEAERWADRAQEELERSFPKLEKSIRIFVNEEDAQKTMHIRKTVIARKRA